MSRMVKKTHPEGNGAILPSSSGERVHCAPGNGRQRRFVLDWMLRWTNLEQACVPAGAGQLIHRYALEQHEEQHGRYPGAYGLDP